MANFILAIVALLIARGLWDFTKERAAVENQYPIVWLLQFLGVLTLLGGIGYGLFVCVIILLTR